MFPKLGNGSFYLLPKNGIFISASIPDIWKLISNSHFRFRKLEIEISLFLKFKSFPLTPVLSTLPF